ncbi:MAG: hypothetical protein HY711_04435, partial [Candidatus Melainabacteria bacterium]|nr:hypothetical protein [Candidatus Melainabacteria bacterium]
GTQPDGSNAFSTYFPGGDSGGTKAGSPLVNPFINKAQWTDFISISVTDVGAERAKDPSAATIAGNAQGQVGYVGIGASATGSNYVSYAIEGVDAAKNALSGSGPNTTLVLSNR